MNGQNAFFIMILGMTAVTVVSRVLPLIYFKSDNMPPMLLRWLSFVPVSVLAALLGPEIFLNNGQLVPISSNIYLWAAIPALFVACYYKSFFGTILFGMACVALARLAGF